MERIADVSQLQVGDIISIAHPEDRRVTLADYVYLRNWRVTNTGTNMVALRGLRVNDNTQTVERNYLLSNRGLQYAVVTVIR